MDRYGGGTKTSKSEAGGTATSTIEPKLSKSRDSRRHITSVGRFLSSALASSHGCPIFSTSFLDFERDLETESDRLPFNCFASFCPLDTFGRCAGIRYPSLINASIWSCCFCFLELDVDFLFGRWASCSRRR